MMEKLLFEVPKTAKTFIFAEMYLSKMCTHTIFILALITFSIGRFDITGKQFLNRCKDLLCELECNLLPLTFDAPQWSKYATFRNMQIATVFTCVHHRV